MAAHGARRAVATLGTAAFLVGVTLASINVTGETYANVATAATVDVVFEVGAREVPSAALLPA